MDASKIYSSQPPPYDVIGDLHGCLPELKELFKKLGYSEEAAGIFIHPENRMPVFIGDLTDRGPDSIGVLKLVIAMVESGRAIFLPGNHDTKLRRWFEGAHIKISRGIETTVREFKDLSPEQKFHLKESFIRLMDEAPPYLILDNGNMVIAHGGMKEKYIGRYDEKVKTLILFGDITGKSDEKGIPERLDWAADYRGKAMVVYGHTPVPYPEIRNNTVNIDAGCAFGGHLCALRYPEKDIVCVKAHEMYYRR